MKDIFEDKSEGDQNIVKGMVKRAVIKPVPSYSIHTEKKSE